MSDSNCTPFNVLILISDQHSKHHLGCYGDSLVRTPNLDGMADQGMRFKNAYCASPLCSPSRMAFMTGRCPSANRVWTNNHILSSAIPTWAHAMGAAGYETTLIGRMHFVGPDQRHGFEKRPIGEYSALYPGADQKGAPLLENIPGTSGQSRRAVECAGRGRTTYQAFDDQIAESTCNYLHQKSKEIRKRPFAAVAGFVLPHCPFFAPNDLFDYYFKQVDVPQMTIKDLAREPDAIRKFKLLRGLNVPLSEERIRIARAAYFGLCEYLDKAIGKVLNKLEETGLNRNTLVIYCSDHGEMAGEHGCWWKSNYYEASVGVPLIVTLPGVVPERKTIPTVCNLMDLGPTIVEMAGGIPMPETDGRSLWTIITGNTDPANPDETFSELLGNLDTVPSRMIRKGPWKLYKYHDTTSPVLYNLKDDPDENTDLGTDPRYEDTRSQLLERLYKEWNPEYVLEESSLLSQDMHLITQWGKAIQPSHTDTLPIPYGAEDIEIL